MFQRRGGRGVLGAVGVGVAAGKGVEVKVVGVRKVEVVVVVDSESESMSLLSRCGIPRGVGWVTTILVDCLFRRGRGCW